ncbi:MAG: transketolase [Spirochaetes bacterium GWB1_66_5]|nr:MAG: transketolase [Spirochaetes bacterium GWB1_66_5]
MAYHSEESIRNLEKIARGLRLKSLEMICRRGAGHPGGCLSAADIIAALYFHKLRVDPARPQDPDRDRFILSKGHASAVLYAALAERGFFPKEDLQDWGKLDCHLQGHPERLKTPGVDMTTGLLGHGVNVGAGLALAARLNRKTYRTYVLLGDGECQAGIVWEGAMTAAKFRLANLTLILDNNDVQLDGFVHDIMPLQPIIDKWKAFNFAVLEIDGHNLRQILEALDEVEHIHDRSAIIVAYTVKGKGVSFMENSHEWHGAVPSAEQMAQARQELLAGA